MYSNKEIKLSLRKYIASTGNTDIDEKSVINLLDDDFSGKYEDVVETIKKIRLLFGVKRQIPDWLKMLTFRFVYHYLCDDTVNKSQEELLKDIGFNKKVFDAYSWNMYSPKTKCSQRKFEPVNFPFTYAEVESNPIYVAMLHYLISEARVNTNTFIDVFGKMGYVPAFCAEGYAHKLLYSAIPNTDYDVNVFYKYYHGITDRPTKTYKVLQRYMAQIQSVLDGKYNEDERDLRIRKIVSDESLIIAMSDSDLCEYSAAKFCDMCFRKPYWEKRNVDEDSIERFISDDYSSIKRAKKFVGISKDDFVHYAKALKKVTYKCSSAMIETVYDDGWYDGKFDGWYDVAVKSRALLYIDVPKVDELKRYKYSAKKYEDLARRISSYNGEWIISWKHHFNDREDMFIETEVAKKFLECIKSNNYPIYEFKFNTPDRNVRNGISFITNINFDNISQQNFSSKYDIKLTKGETFKKIEVK